MFEPIRNIASNLSEIVAAQANIERVTGLLEEEPQIKDRPDVIEKYGTAFEQKRENWEPIKGDITFEDVTFHYPDGNENILEHFNPSCSGRNDQLLLSERQVLERVHW